MRGNKHHWRCGAFTLIELMVVLAIIAVMFGLTLAAVQRARSAAARTTCLNRLRQIGLAHHQHHDGRGVLPPGLSVTLDDGAYPFMSWMVRLLPYLDQVAEWDTAVAAFRENKNFQAVPPHTGYSKPNQAFACPADSRVLDESLPRSGALTSYLGVSGSARRKWDGMLFIDSTTRSRDVTDGLSHTLLVGERPPSGDLVFGWWYGGWGQHKNGSADVVLSVREANYYLPPTLCPPGARDFAPGNIDDHCSTFHFWSLHSGGAYFIFCDGSVRFLSYSLNSLLPALSTRAGGETVSSWE